MSKMVSIIFAYWYSISTEEKLAEKTQVVGSKSQKR